MSDEYIDIHEVAYHRNGIAGEGFYAICFSWDDDGTYRKMLGVVFPDDNDSFGYNPRANPHTAVFDVNELAVDNIAFARGNSWRGDRFDHDLRDAIDKAEARQSVS